MPGETGLAGSIRCRWGKGSRVIRLSWAIWVMPLISAMCGGQWAMCVPMPMMLFCTLARPERFELPTPWFEAKCSIQLSYGRRLLLKHESQRCRESGEIVGQVWEMESDKK